METIINYVQQYMWQAWIITSILLLIMELSSGDFYLLSFAIAAAVTSLAAALGVGLYGCLAIFAIASLLTLFFVRPVLVKKVGRKHEKLSNGDAIIGRIGRVSQTIVADSYGRVAIDGDDWKATTTDGQDIPVGAKVKVVKRESIILTVTTEA